MYGSLVHYILTTHPKALYRPSCADSDSWALSGIQFKSNTAIHLLSTAIHFAGHQHYPDVWHHYPDVWHPAGHDILEWPTWHRAIFRDHALSDIDHRQRDKQSDLTATKHLWPITARTTNIYTGTRVTGDATGWSWNNYLHWNRPHGVRDAHCSLERRQVRLIECEIIKIFSLRLRNLNSLLSEPKEQHGLSKHVHQPSRTTFYG